MPETMIRIKRREGFTVLPNELLRDKRLSLRAKGLICMMLSLPPNWKDSVSGLCSICGSGKDAVRSSLREMENAGYLTREQTHDKGGKFAGSVYVIRDYSGDVEAAEDEPAEHPAPLGLKPPTVEPPAVDPSAENPPLLNKDRLNKDLSNTPLTPQGDGRRRRRNKSEPDYEPEWFERFWQKYPNQKARIRAVAAWDKLRPDKATCMEMSRALDADHWPRRWHDEGGEYIPHPATWLNNRRWEDKPPKLPPTTSSHGGRGGGRVVEAEEVRYD